MSRHRIFLLSPANAGGERASMLFRPGAGFDLAVRLRGSGAPLGEAFAFISGLYFRGKLAYSQAFAAPPPDVQGAFVITSGLGLVPPETIVTLDHLRQIASVPIDAAEPRYREPLEQGCRTLVELAGDGCEFVLLGSVATVSIRPDGRRLRRSSALSRRVRGPRRYKPGRPDAALRARWPGVDLRPAWRITRHGPRPPKLPKLR